jgi:hypothetical protein
MYGNVARDAKEKVAEVSYKNPYQQTQIFDVNLFGHGQLCVSLSALGHSTEQHSTQ